MFVVDEQRHRQTVFRLEVLMSFCTVRAHTENFRVESLERESPYRVSLLNDGQAHDRDALLATHLDGQRINLDHGYPLRLIGPGRPGVNQTKWVTRLVVQ